MVYGIVHRNTLAKQAEIKRKQEEYAFKEELIKEAKAEYQRRKNTSAGSSILIKCSEADVVAEIDWNDPKSVEAGLERLATERH